MKAKIKIIAADHAHNHPGAWTAVHHAFTSPKPEWIDRFEEDPGAALAYAKELGCEGLEVGLNVAGLRTGSGSGSISIT